MSKGMNIDEIVALGKEGFRDLMLDQLRRRSEDPSLSNEERTLLLEQLQKAEARVAELRKQPEVAPV